MWRLLPELIVDVLGLNMRTSWVYTYDVLFAGPIVQYSVALYWSVMTITTIGYGDIVAHNTVERILSVFCMIFGATLYVRDIASMSAGYVTKFNVINRPIL